MKSTFSIAGLKFISVKTHFMELPIVKLGIIFVEQDECYFISPQTVKKKARKATPNHP